MTKRAITKKLIVYEIIGFLIVILTLWADEILDLPHVLFGAPATPINWTESIFETVLTIILAVITIFSSWKLLQRLRHLEGFLPVCAFCKKIRVNNEWIPIEEFISKRSDAVFSHSLCPQCAEQHYPEIFANEDTKNRRE